MENKMVKVTNRNNGTTGYVIRQDGINRSWERGQSQMIPLAELEKLTWEPGGQYILDNLLMVEDIDALQELNMEVEPEYHYTEKDIREILLTGSLDALKDFLDFAPNGAIELAKQIAVDEKIPDSNKRRAIYESTGFNVDNAIMVNTIVEAVPEEESNVDAEGKKVRRVAPKETEKVRRTEPKKYKVVTKG